MSSAPSGAAGQRRVEATAATPCRAGHAAAGSLAGSSSSARRIMASALPSSRSPRAREALSSRRGKLPYTASTDACGAYRTRPLRSGAEHAGQRLHHFFDRQAQHRQRPGSRGVGAGGVHHGRMEQVVGTAARRHPPRPRLRRHRAGVGRAGRKDGEEVAHERGSQSGTRVRAGDDARQAQRDTSRSFASILIPSIKKRSSDSECASSKNCTAKSS